MLRRLEERAYWWLRVPPEPVPPAGAPGSLKTFRAGRNFLYLRLVLWGATQAGAIVGLVFSLYFIREVEIQMELEQAAQAREAAAAALQAEVDQETADNPTTNDEAVEDSPAAGDQPEPVAADAANAETIEPYDTAALADKAKEDGVLTDEEEREIVRSAFHQVIHRVAPRWFREMPSRIPGDALVWMRLAESIGIVGFVIQFFWSLLAVRIDYKQRWYMVTDRSLRLRWGVVKIQETTMSFANLQQVSVKQGPLQRLLKLADVEVRSAGGGSGEAEKGEEDSMHRSVFRAVENAPEIRDLILERLKRFRQAGLGEPDDPNQSESALIPGAAQSTSVATVDAAKELLSEARALRVTLSGERAP